MLQCFLDMQVLSQNAVTCDANMNEDSPLLQLCVNACYSPDLLVSVKAITILVRIACYWYVYTNYIIDHGL